MLPGTSSDNDQLGVCSHTVICRQKAVSNMTSYYTWFRTGVLTSFLKFPSLRLQQFPGSCYPRLCLYRKCNLKLRPWLIAPSNGTEACRCCNTQLQAVMLHASQPQMGLGIAAGIAFGVSACCVEEEEGSALITYYL